LLHSFKLVALKMVTPGKAHLEKHCALYLPGIFIEMF
jgi:hypothetical protein